jgi:hypothetical protein
MRRYDKSPEVLSCESFIGANLNPLRDSPCCGTNNLEALRPSQPVPSSCTDL